MKKVLSFAIALTSLCLFPAAALAAGGAVCQSAGGSCGLETQCASVPNAVNLGAQDCSELGVGYTCCSQGATPQTQNASPVPAATPAASTPAGSANFSLQLPSCTVNGNCTLDDIVQTGVAFANLLMALSGALFFATFIYGGAMYLLSFGRSEWVSKGSKAMTGAMIGMGIVLAAWTIVKYIVVAIAP